MMTLWRWSPRVNSKPAAWPSLRAISAVMGAVLAVPRIPSVPNRRRLGIWVILYRYQSFPDAQSLDRFHHVMHAQEICTLRNGVKPGRERAGKALRGVCLATDLADESFSRKADQHGMAECHETTCGPQEVQILGGALGEAEAGIERDIFRADPGFDGGFTGGGE